VHVAGEDSWKYERIAGDLRARIRSGEYAPGSRLPSKSELKAAHGVSDGPVNEAVKVLRGEGLVESRQGSGLFVCDPLPEVALSEYETVMGRIDGLAEEVRRLRGEVTELRRAREA
jgi:DNA-binding GntR family transcriptional regulator